MVKIKRTGVFATTYGAVGGFDKDGNQKNWLTYVKRFAKPTLVFLAAGFFGLNTQLGYGWASALGGFVLAVDKVLQDLGWY